MPLSIFLLLMTNFPHFLFWFFLLLASAGSLVSTQPHAESFGYAPVNTDYYLIYLSFDDLLFFLSFFLFSFSLFLCMCPFVSFFYFNIVFLNSFLFSFVIKFLFLSLILSLFPSFFLFSGMNYFLFLSFFLPLSFFLFASLFFAKCYCLTLFYFCVIVFFVIFLSISFSYVCFTLGKPRMCK